MQQIFLIPPDKKQIFLRVELGLWRRSRRMTRVKPILSKQFFFRNFESKVSAVQFLLYLDSLYGIHLPTFWTFPIICNRTEIACHVTPTCSASSYLVGAEFTMLVMHPCHSSKGVHLAVHLQDWNFLGQTFYTINYTSHDLQHSLQKQQNSFQWLR